MRYIFIILFHVVCVCNLLQAQTIYYNKTHDIIETINTYDDIWIVNQDTILVDGFMRDTFGKRYKTYSYINNFNGDTISTFRYGRDTMDIYGGWGNNLFIKNDILYSVGAMYDGQLYPNLLKFSLNGNLLLDTLYNLTNAYSRFDCILPTGDGNFILFGSKEVSFGNLDAWLVKMDPFGNILWEQTYGGAGVDMGFSISKNIDDTFILSMFFDRDGINKSQIWLKKIDPSGNSIWEKFIGGEDYDGAFCKVLSDSTLFVYGTLSTPQNLNAHPFFMKIDNDGNELWRTFPDYFPFIESSQNGWASMIENIDKTIILSGWKWDGVNTRTIGFLQKITPDGDSIWHRELSIRNNENYLTDLKMMINGDFLIAGYVFPDSPDNTEDGWLMRTNCLGYFEHPKDSVVFSGDGVILNAQNFSTYFDYTTIAWGDGEIDTLYEGDLQTINHLYPLPGNYTIETKTVACNDTIRKTIDYTANPPNLTGQNLSVFPNPNDGNFKVWLNSDEVFQMEVFDYNGRLVFTSSGVKLNTGYSLDLTSFDSAVYFLKASSSDNVFQSRIIITH